jgi:predicted ATPase
MEAMKAAAEQARVGHGQIVAAMAEPGVGKSRLVFEFKARNQSGWMVLEAFSVSYGKASAYLPVLDLLHGYFKIAGEDDEQTRREKIAGRLSMLDPLLEDTRPYLFSLLGIVEGTDPLAQMDGQLKKRRTLEAIKRILLRESLNQPLIVIFEDLHWIDEQTQAFLDLLAESIASACVLLLVNYRPEYQHGWGSRTYYTQLRLDALGKNNVSEILTALIGDNPELAPLRPVIIDRSEGNPLFIEEIVLALFEDGSLTRNGTVKLTRPIAAIGLPPAVKDILAARIDRLEPEAKELLQTLAVIGTEIPLGLVKRVVSGSDEELQRLLSRLQLGEFIYERPAFPDVEYTFKHALTQDVAYQSVLTERRKRIHDCVAAAMEELFSETLTDQYAELARHYRLSSNTAKAIKYRGLQVNKLWLVQGTVKPYRTSPRA